jgi:1-acyl-sn-glycerol-3-phosphate acyltransferase
MKRLKLVWLNVSFYVLFLSFSLVGIPLLALSVAAIAPFVSRRATLRRVRRAISWYGKVVIFILPYPWIRIQYRSRLPRAEAGPFIFVCNHLSASDPFLMGCLPYECVQIVKDWPMRLPVLGIAARLAGYLSIHEMAVEDFYRLGAQLLRDGVSIISFPEGTRSVSGTMGPFHSAIFHLAVQARVPIVPICIHGNHEIPARGTLRLRPGLIKVHVLPAISEEAYRGLNPFQLKSRVWTALDQYYTGLVQTG